MSAKFRELGPYTEDKGICPLCKKGIKAGEMGTLIAYEADGEETQKMAEGKPFNAKAMHVHLGCAEGLKEYFENSNVLDEILEDTVNDWVRRRIKTLNAIKEGALRR